MSLKKQESVCFKVYSMIIWSKKTEVIIEELNNLIPNLSAPKNLFVIDFSSAEKNYDHSLT